MRQVFLKLLCLPLLMIAPWTGAAGAPGESAPAIWVTWKGAEPDKGASAWYLKRFVRRDVRFREVDSGLLDLGAGTPFDVPQAQFRRTHQLSVYEQLQRAYPVADPIASRIGDIIHDIEINLWRPKKFPESSVIETAALEYAKSRVDGAIPISCYIEWFDLVYSKLGKDGTLDTAPRFPRECGAKTPD